MNVLSIVVPTYNENQTVRLLIDQLEEALRGFSYEVIFVDDSSDNTPEVLAQLCADHPRVRCIHREGQRGLATAVLEGFRLARGSVLAVMDADLQHPPEVLTRMYREIGQGADVVIASRHLPGGDDGGLHGIRKVISRTARMIGKAALHRVRSVSDPMSGFFMIRRQVIEGVHLNPVGWKILMEIVVKGRYSHLVEIPYAFRPRAANESKMSPAEMINYLRHVARLVVQSPDDRRFWLFALVGISGVAVNTLLFALLTRWRIFPETAAFVSGSLAMIWNFAWNCGLTWRDAPQSDPLAVTFAKYAAVALIGIAVNLVVLSVLFRLLDVPKEWANLTGIIGGALVNYRLNDRWTWRRVGHKRPRMRVS
ncbi:MULTISPECIES: glycosyltransferase family 2 protein [Kyrpidia]|uniref:Glycosyltransferase n=1 Tax=Kyrpidia spormannii TaxID=2055160 RepID=A0ACA8Z9N6_9BACL|nr:MULTISPECIES: glycosyltransferase family 2 protein [Kyrpidia]MCL6574790.1 glycosyltransferase family 2 protein [Kyrpidia sp.]CAB3392580.1 putative glycosyltransferase [Kyrpidia spormannii]